MNKEAIRRVANAIARAERTKTGLFGKIGFNMYRFITQIDPELDIKDHVDSCGTVACIAGWTCLMELEDKIDVILESGNNSDYSNPGTSMFVAIADIQGNNIQERARQILGLDVTDACNLFDPRPNNTNLSNITASEAVLVLRHLAKTGEVDWSIIN